MPLNQSSLLGDVFSMHSNFCGIIGWDYWVRVQESWESNTPLNSCSVILNNLYEAHQVWNLLVDNVLVVTLIICISHNHFICQTFVNISASVFLHTQSSNFKWACSSCWCLPNGYFIHEPRAVTIKLWELKRKCLKAVPNHFQNHVMWSWALN